MKTNDGNDTNHRSETSSTSTSRRASPRGYERHVRGRRRGGTPAERHYLRMERRRAREFDKDGAPIDVATFIELSLGAGE